jgi:hypothetical protein
MLADPLSSGSRRLKGGGSQDWLPTLSTVSWLPCSDQARQTTETDGLSYVSGLEWSTLP